MQTEPNSEAGDQYLLKLTRHVQAEEIKICLWKNTDDGYRWEGYGSRRLSDGSSHRKSYYRCLNVRVANCCNAKKVLQEHPTDSRVVMVTYKGRHNHSPLKNVIDANPILKILELPFDDSVDVTQALAPNTQCLPLEFINQLANGQANKPKDKPSPPLPTTLQQRDSIRLPDNHFSDRLIGMDFGALHAHSQLSANETSVPARGFSEPLSALVSDLSFTPRNSQIPSRAPLDSAKFTPQQLTDIMNDNIFVRRIAGL
eukprot:c19347_g2_i5.p1 GENE.c19347_g2_i5~~c19347_g2_i5.p1  ORF type:complete len:257 (+),score=29.03 c19347_g2_i5:92-862(+)